MPDELRLLFTKDGKSRYISHLDLIRTLQRAFLRGGMHIKHSEGYVPHPFVSVALPLSVGYHSSCELMDFVLLDGARIDEVKEKLNRVLPDGIEILDCYPQKRPFKELAYLKYKVELLFSEKLESDVAAKISNVFSQNELIVKKKSKKSKTGFTMVDIIPLIKNIEIVEDENKLTIVSMLKAQNPGLNPQVLVTAIFDHITDFQPDLTVFTRVECYDDQGVIFR